MNTTQKEKTIQEIMSDALHLANVQVARKGALIQWRNYLGIWQTGRVETPYHAGFRTITVRRLPPEDSEGLPNHDTICLSPHERPGSIRVVE